MRGTPRISGIELYRGALSLLTLGIAVYTGGETARIAPFAFGAVVLICLELLLLPGIRYVNLPFLQLSLLFIFCYDSFDTFIKFVWLLPLVLVALILHLRRLRPRLRFGPTLLPLLLVALATVLGGVGMISPGEYFRPVVLGYLVGLGPGLVLTYILMKNELRAPDDESAWLRDFFWWGTTAAAIVFFYALPPLLRGGKLPYLQWSNNVSTMLMIAMPAVAARVQRYPVLFPLLVTLPAAMVLTGSRAGLLFAPVELLICIVWLICSAKGWRRRLFHACWALLLVVAVFVWGVPLMLALIESTPEHFKPVTPDDVRWKLVVRAFENFRENPLFGSGLGYQGNSDLYNGKMGTIHWYHVFPAQVLGGLGIFGALAWGFQLVTRLLVAIRVRKRRAFVLTLCYGGLLLMSMVNPGEFCPVPYAFLAVSLFALVENHVFGADTRLWLVPFPKRQKKQEEPAVVSEKS